jgi:hypothetical protein
MPTRLLVACSACTDPPALADAVLAEHPTRPLEQICSATPERGDGRSLIGPARRPRARTARSPIIAALILALVGCSGEPSERELKNRRELEALLTAISLKNKKELDRDVHRIEERHTSGELSDAPYRALQEIIKKAQSGDWAAAEKQAYEFREAAPFFQ